MIGLSVAIGRFAEALLWGILRTAGMVGVWMLIGVVVLVTIGLVVRRVMRRR